VKAALAASPEINTEDGDGLRCPECSQKFDVDEDEWDRGEILSCASVSSSSDRRTHPVAESHSDDLDEEDEERAEDIEEDEPDENGDLPDDDEDDEEDDA